jgi:hypothetical protein
VSASALAASLTGRSSAGVIQREQTVRSPPPPATTTTHSDRPVDTPTEPSPDSRPPEPAPFGLDTGDTRAQFERILELLEERILAQLERRGGRYRGGF